MSEIVRRHRLDDGHRGDLLLSNPEELWLEFMSDGSVRWVTVLKNDRLPWRTFEQGER